MLAISGQAPPPFEAAPPVLVIGVGNRFAGDDAVGPAVAELLGRSSGGAFQVLEHSGDGADLMSRWGEAEIVVLIDAVRSGAEPGAVLRFDASAAPLPAPAFQRSSHAFGLAEAVEVSRALHQLPRRVIVFGIEGGNFEVGAGLTPAVAGRLPSVAEQILQELRSLARAQDFAERA